MKKTVFVLAAATLAACGTTHDNMESTTKDDSSSTATSGTFEFIPFNCMLAARFEEYDPFGAKMAVTPAGVKVLGVADRGIARTMELKDGDVITKLNSTAVTTPFELRYNLRKLACSSTRYYTVEFTRPGTPQGMSAKVYAAFPQEDLNSLVLFQTIEELKDTMGFGPVVIKLP